MRDKFRCSVPACKKLFIYAENSKLSHLDWITSILHHVGHHLKKGEIGMKTKHVEKQEILDPRDCKCESCEGIFTDDANIESIEDIGYCIKCYNNLRQDIQPLPPRE